MIHVEVSDIIEASREKVFRINAYYPDWPKFFPDMKSVRLVREEGERTVLEVDDVQEGLVTLAQVAIPPDRIEREINRRSIDGRAVYMFEALPNGSTRMTLSFGVSLKGIYKLGKPFAKGIVRKRLNEFIFEPLKKIDWSSVS